MRFPPVFLISTSKIIGAAGICSTNDVICIAKDFPLWFIFLTIIHELWHYIFNHLPINEELKNGLTENMEFVSHQITLKLPHKYREKAIIDQDQVMRYITWECSVYASDMFNPETDKLVPND